MLTNNPGTDDFSSRLSEIVKKLKENEQFKEDYAGMNIHDQDLIYEAKREAYREKAVEDATKMLKENISLEKVARCTGLSLKRVQNLQKKLKAKAIA